VKKYIIHIHHLNKSKVKIIYRGVNTEDSELTFTKNDLNNKYNIPEDQFITISVGRHNSRKRFDLGKKAINEIIQIKNQIKL